MCHTRAGGRLRNNAATAKELYVALEPFDRRVSQLGTSFDRVRGLLAHSPGAFGSAQTHFEDALAFCRKADYRFGLTWSCCDYADMFLERDSDGDRQKAFALLDESLAISSGLGMSPDGACALPKEEPSGHRRIFV